MNVWLWVGFTLFIVVMLAVDLGLFQRRPHVIRMKEALAWFAFWTGLALLFNVGVILFHQRGVEAGKAARARLGANARCPVRVVVHHAHQGDARIGGGLERVVSAEMPRADHGEAKGRRHRRKELLERPGTP